ncbi:N-acetylglucosamine-6-phosphate deacetylase [Sagittula stellata]|uniref:N-acetylglucosamine-6-phosphate deacetylase n=1 Tax=Sagittula stellata (strain ATCC 700073 / DSM 11524 / E-37) TaxID=388399 RepID=A3K7F6_SAGS3|nr:N-acetylglucosamine-6-phosphate deacetylase [Sagittula stellata]EBA06915.1 N-acetylglucosamine-6-phosphate deacetylase [Sagittula stellata E-37]
MRYLHAPDIFDGVRHLTEHALAVEDGRLRAIVHLKDAPEAERLDGTILPGFVDLQVNGGGGVLFNEETTVEGLRTIAEAHARTGTTHILPTLITDTPDKVRAAIDAVAQAVAQAVPGIVGLHLEGPHLSLARKGAHDPALIRPMTEADAEVLADAAARLPNLKVTIAPESVPLDLVRRLLRAGVILSLGHSDCSYETACAYFDAGVRCATHLFNAMSQMGNRAPGMVGAILDRPDVSAGIIADGIHVHTAALRIALNAHKEKGALFLVTDAMPPVGSDITEYVLNGRRVLRRDGRLTLEDGTLAGADLDMPTALKVLDGIGVPRIRALAMATCLPARLLRTPGNAGLLRSGDRFDGIRLDADGRFVPL